MQNLTDPGDHWTSGTQEWDHSSDVYSSLRSSLRSEFSVFSTPNRVLFYIQTLRRMFDRFLLAHPGIHPRVHLSFEVLRTS